MLDFLDPSKNNLVEYSTYDWLNEKQYSIHAQYPKARAVLSIMAPWNLMVQGGLKSSRSSVNMMAGIAWKPKSGKNGSCSSSGNKRRLSMRLMPQ